LQYTAHLKKHADGTFFAEIEALPGCITEGDTENEALEMLTDIKKAFFAIAMKRNLYAPEIVTETTCI
jgi:predicted RNase H-like HicB family nuclease